MIKGSVASIESLGLVDGPGIRTVVFLNGCKLRCMYCHNPEMWNKLNDNYSSDDLVKKILRFKPYWKDRGGVTFSGGEPLLQIDFLIDVCKKLKENNVHIALDTAGVGIGEYEQLLPFVDLIIFDVKHIDHQSFIDLTGSKDDEVFKFLEAANNLNKKFWVRQVIVPGIMDNDVYIKGLKSYIDRYIKNVLKVEFLPYHKLGSEKYAKLGIEYPLNNVEEMDSIQCENLLKMFNDLK